MKVKSKMFDANLERKLDGQEIPKTRRVSQRYSKNSANSVLFVQLYEENKRRNARWSGSPRSFPLPCHWFCLLPNPSDFIILRNGRMKTEIKKCEENELKVPISNTLRVCMRFFQQCYRAK